EDDKTKQDENWYDKFLEKTQKGAKTAKKTQRKHRGRVCYVDPNELFPQATYYVSQQVQRPNYYAETHEQEEISVSSTMEKVVHSEDEEEEAITTPIMEAKADDKGTDKVDAPLLVLTDTLISDAKGSMDTHETKESANQGDTIQSQAKKKKTKTKTKKKRHQKKYGTWDGVFVNVLISILGVIMFLRLAFVVGETGLPYFILILFLSTLAMCLTTLSLSAICSNGLQKGGGAYYMVSRTIGPHIGTAIGLLLDIRLYGVILSIITLVWTLLGVDLFMQSMYWLILVLLISISSFVIGCFLPHEDKTGQLVGIKGWTNGNFLENMKPHYNVDGGIRYDFWQALALFFRLDIFFNY
ncbi:ion transporter, partial [Reticulomyxa filosa]